MSKKREVEDLNIVKVKRGLLGCERTMVYFGVAVHFSAFYLDRGIMFKAGQQFLRINQSITGF